MIIRLLLPMSMETTHDPKEPVLLMALKIMRHAKLCLSTHQKARSNGTAKRDRHVSNLLFVSCGFNPSTSLNTVRNLCLRSPVKS